MNMLINGQSTREEAVFEFLPKEGGRAAFSDQRKGVPLFQRVCKTKENGVGSLATLHAQLSVSWRPTLAPLLSLVKG